MQFDHATRFVVRRYAPVVKPDAKLPVDPEIQKRADEIVYLYVREKVNKKTGKLQASMHPSLYDRAISLMEEYNMTGSYTVDLDNRDEVLDAMMFEATSLVNMAAIALAEQEKITSKRTKDEHLTDKMLRIMDVVYEEMMKLYNDKQSYTR